jgi:hypothetical protein
VGASVDRGAVIQKCHRQEGRRLPLHKELKKLFENKKIEG